MLGIADRDLGLTRTTHPGHHRTCVPAKLPVRQVHGWIADQTGRFLFRDDADGTRFQLAGGQREIADRDWVRTLFRESAGACQVTLAWDSIVYLGH